MGYRIHLQTKKETIEIRDETPIGEFSKLKGEEKKEYPDYLIDQKAMEKILEFYQKRLHEHYKEIYDKIKNKQEIQSFYHFCTLSSYFKKVDLNNLIIDSDNFALQYFYLVEIYKNTDWRKITYKITHG